MTYLKKSRFILTPEQVAREQRFVIFCNQLTLTPAKKPKNEKQRIGGTWCDHPRYMKSETGQLILFDAPYNQSASPENTASVWLSAASCPYAGNGGTYPRLSCLKSNKIDLHDYIERATEIYYGD